MEFTSTEAETLAKIFRWRRDVRHFKTTPIAEDVLDRLRHAMDGAPSVGNSRPWRVIRINNPSLRASVRANFNLCNAEAATGYKDEQQIAKRLLLLLVQTAILHANGRRQMQASHFLLNEADSCAKT